MGNASLRLCYRLENLGEEPLAWLWAAHPQFAVDAGCRVVLPSEVREVLEVCEPGRGWLPEGTPVHWPKGAPRRGPRTAIDRLGPSTGRDFWKLYLRPEQHVGWAALEDAETGDRLRLGWDPGSVPYLGLWFDNGSVSPMPTIALEPSTGFYDDLGHAHQNGRAATTGPRQSTEWELTIQLETARTET